MSIPLKEAEVYFQHIQGLFIARANSLNREGAREDQINWFSIIFERFIKKTTENRNMKKERVYREILYGVLEERRRVFKQLELSKACRLSLSTVNYALKPLESMNAIEKRRSGFNVLDPKKVLLYWASIRRLGKSIVYQTYLDKPVEEIESEIPPRSVFTAYSAFKLRFNRVPSDYGEVVVYGVKEDFEKRFGKEDSRFNPNLMVLNLDDHLTKFKVVPMSQIFVDLWNLRSWYARDFLKEMEGIIDGILERYSSR